MRIYCRLKPDDVGLSRVAEKLKKYKISALSVVGGFEVSDDLLLKLLNCANSL